MAEMEEVVLDIMKKVSVNRRAYMKRLINVNDAKEVCLNRTKLRSVVYA